MAGTTKNEVSAQTKEELVAQQVDFAINNSFIDGLSKQLDSKVQNGMVFPPDYNVSNALMGAYLTLKETTDKDGKPLLKSARRQVLQTALWIWQHLDCRYRKSRDILSHTKDSASSRSPILET